jgi:hypothetical protein
MSRMLKSLIPLSVLGLAACTTTTARMPNGVAITTTNRPSVVSVVGTPFLLAFKVPVCVGSLVLAGPIAGISMLTPPTPDKIELRDDLERGTEENCGQPYVVTP